MKVLVVYATRHGATAGIAGRIAGTLARRGLEVTLRSADEVDAVDGYDAYVVGGAAYMTHWLDDATSFARRNRRSLGQKPLWLFSSGPLGTELIDRKGQDVLQASEPREFTELRVTLHPRDTQVFFGAYDPHAQPVGIAERLTRHLPASWRNEIPSGDFRDWAGIESWANGIADQLLPVLSPV